jgi:AcrR family transcriptional regulator
MTEDTPETELPRGVALAWGVAAHPQRGPKRELSIERIVETAIEIADADGLGAVSMSSIATRLGFTTMSLYRYVTAKDDLILLMQEYGTGLPPAAIADAPDWRTGLSLWRRASLESYMAHPWLIDVPISGTPNTPNNLQWMDGALAALDGTPLSPQERVAVLLLVTGQARWEASVIRGYAAAPGTITENDRANAHILKTLVTPEDFPALHPVIESGAFEAEDDPFSFGFELLLDGVERYIESGLAGSVLAAPAYEEPVSYPKDPAVREARQARREAEGKLREAQKREREALRRAAERSR